MRRLPHFISTKIHLNASTAAKTAQTDDDALDAYSQTVGITAAMIIPARGIRFAVIANQGKALRSYLGLMGRSVPIARAIALSHSLSQEEGVEVMQVETGSPADRAGVRAGDVVLTLSGSEIRSVDDLHRVLFKLPSGKVTSVTVLREHVRQELAITPMER